MDKIKAFIEKWNHRLQGHLLVTYNDGDGYHTVYALDVCTIPILNVNDYGELVTHIIIDSCFGNSIELPAYTHITITGA